MKFNGVLQGGLHNGDMATIVFDGEFKIGMQIVVGDEVFEVMDGPAAQHHQKLQQGHENLAVGLKYLYCDVPDEVG